MMRERGGPVAGISLPSANSFPAPHRFIQVSYDKRGKTSTSWPRGEEISRLERLSLRINGSVYRSRSIDG